MTAVNSPRPSRLALVNGRNGAGRDIPSAKAEWPRSVDPGRYLPNYEMAPVAPLPPLPRASRRVSVNEKLPFVSSRVPEVRRIRAFIADKIAGSVVDYAPSSSRNALASLRSGVPKPSVNQP
jgi:hypothetical protein